MFNLGKQQNQVPGDGKNHQVAEREAHEEGKLTFADAHSDTMSDDLILPYTAEDILST